jgi:hypothetical protein
VRRAQPQVLPLARREAGLIWQAGLRAFEWIGDPAHIPFPRNAQWVLAFEGAADAGLTRLPLRGQRRNWTGFPFSLSRTLAGSPDSRRTVGNAADDVKNSQCWLDAASASVRRGRTRGA